MTWRDPTVSMWEKTRRLAEPADRSHSKCFLSRDQTNAGQKRVPPAVTLNSDHELSGRERWDERKCKYLLRERIETIHKKHSVAKEQNTEIGDRTAALGKTLMPDEAAALR